MSKRWIGLIFIVASLVFSAAVYPQLPERIATHFNVRGVADGWSGRFWGAFAMPCVALLMLAVFNVVPRILPRAQNFARFEDTYWLVANLIIAFLCAMNFVTVGSALGWPVSVPTFVLLSIGALFMILGNFMPRIRSNWMMGIRTPWTLDNETVWRETHRLGGRTFMVGGIATMIAAFLPPRIQPIVAITALVIAGFIPVIYSYVVWRRQNGS